MKKLFLSIFILVIAGCGYKPTVNYVQNSIEGPIYTVLDVNTENSRDSAYLKEYVNNLLLTQFNTTLVSNKKLAKMIMEIKLDNITQKSLQTDTNGYVKIYKLTSYVKIKYYKNIENPKVKVLVLSNYSNYIVDDDSTITANNKEIAIRESINRILKSFLFTIAVDNFDK